METGLGAVAIRTRYDQRVEVGGELGISHLGFEVGQCSLDSPAVGSVRGEASSDLSREYASPLDREPKNVFISILIRIRPP